MFKVLGSYKCDTKDQQKRHWFKGLKFLQYFLFNCKENIVTFVTLFP